jgi:hypothetical protein
MIENHPTKRARKIKATFSFLVNFPTKLPAQFYDKHDKPGKQAQSQGELYELNYFFHLRFLRATF